MFGIESWSEFLRPFDVAGRRADRNASTRAAKLCSWQNVWSAKEERDASFTRNCGVSNDNTLQRRDLCESDRRPSWGLILALDATMLWESHGPR